jgi:hypothetical protein
MECTHALEILASVGKYVIDNEWHEECTEDC